MAEKPKAGLYLTFAGVVTVEPGNQLLHTVQYGPDGTAFETLQILPDPLQDGTEPATITIGEHQFSLENHDGPQEIKFIGHQADLLHPVRKNCIGPDSQEDIPEVSRFLEAMGITPRRKPETKH